MVSGPLAPAGWRAYAPPADLLADRVVLVTGAGDGIGRAVALGCARHGARVVLLGRTVRKLEATYDAIERAGGPQPAIYPMNLEGAAPPDYATLAETLRREFGRLDALAHLAADAGEPMPLRYHDPRLWMRMLQVNLNAAFLLTQACLDLLLEAPRAAVLFTTDGAAARSEVYRGGYGVAKYALRGLVAAWARELDSHPGLSLALLQPGPTRTRLRAKLFPAEDHSHLALPEDWVPAYLYALGPQGPALGSEPWDLASAPG